MSMYGVRGGKNPSAEFWPLQLHVPATRNADANGSYVDRYRNGGYNALTLMVLPGDWTDGTHAFIIEEADDDGSGSPTGWGAVSTDDLINDTSGTFVPITADTTTVQCIDYIGRKRYVRVRYDYTAGSTGAAFAVLALLFSPSIYPAA